MCKNLEIRRALEKTKDLAICQVLCFAELVGSVVLFSNNLCILVVTASLAYAVCKIVLAALGALYKVGGSFELPNARASFHLSRMRNLFLRYCHC